MVYEKLAFLQQALTFAFIWAAVGEFQSQQDTQDNVQVLGELQALAVALALVVGATLLAAGWTSGADWRVSAAMALQAVLFLPTILIEYNWIKQGRFRSALALMGFTTLALVSVAFLPAFTELLPAEALRLLPAVAAVRLIFAVPRLYEGLAAVSAERVIRRARRLLPVVGSYLLAGSQLYWAGLSVSWLLPESEFLIFRYGCRELPFAHLVTAPVWMHTAAVVGGYRSRVQQTWLVRWAGLWLRRETLRTVHLLFPAYMVFFAAAPWVYHWAYGAELSQAALPFQLLLLAVGASALAPRGFLIGCDQRRLLFRISLLEASVHAALSLLLTLLWGVPGAALALTLGVWFEKLLLVRASARLGLKPSGWIPWRLYLAYGAAFAALALIQFTTSEP